jgi:hypothetical protein
MTGLSGDGARILLPRPRSANAEQLRPQHTPRDQQHRAPAVSRASILRRHRAQRGLVASRAINWLWTDLLSPVPMGLPRATWDAAPPAGKCRQVHPAAGDPWVVPGATPQPIAGVSATHERAGEVTKRPRVYELKIRGVASDLVRAEADDVELWEVPGLPACERVGPTPRSCMG